MTNLEKYKKDLDSLITRGDRLYVGIQLECDPDKFKAAIKKQMEKRVEGVPVSPLPRFTDEYQSWYSEARALIRQLLPDRLADFVRHYEKPKPRKEITAENYRIEDYLQGLTVTRTSGYGTEKIVGLDAAIPHVREQENILKAVSQRFESSLFDIRQLVQADLFDSELDAAGELAKNKFTRAAGALAGVVLG